MRISDWSSDVCSAGAARLAYDSSRNLSTVWRHRAAPACATLLLDGGAAGIAAGARRIWDSPHPWPSGVEAGGSAGRGLGPKRMHHVQVDILGHEGRSEEHTSELQSLLRI